MNISAQPTLDRPVTTYVRPTNVDEVVQHMTAGSSALAGGTDLVLMRRASQVSPRCVVDLKHVAELGQIVDDHTFSIGATVTIERVTALDALRFGALVDGARVLGAPQTRARATLGGNVCRASPAGDTLASLLVLGAEVELASIQGRRTVPLARFFTGPGMTLREPTEIATRLVIPPIRGTSAYERQTYRRWLDLAVAGVAVRVVLDADGRCADAALAVTALAPTPLNVPAAAAELVGVRPDADVVARVSAAIREAVNPISDVRGTREYRLRVIPSLVRRALRRAIERSGASLA
jgi:carbon-monoxide dehydrogenase medium subunit